MGTVINTTSLADAINAHCREFEGSDEFRDMIKAHVRGLYDSAIKDVFRWGKFPDAVKKSLEEALPGNLSDIVDLPKYNLLLARCLNEQWQENATSESLVSQMQALIKGIIEEDQLPKYIKASALWQAYMEQYLDDATHEGWERPLAIAEINEEAWGKFFKIGLDKEKPSSGSRFSREKESFYECETYLGFRLETQGDGREKTPVIKDGHEVYSLYTGKLEYSDVLGKNAVQFRSRFERLVGALYYGNSLLVLDESDPDEIYYPGAY